MIPAPTRSADADPGAAVSDLPPDVPPPPPPSGGLTLTADDKTWAMASHALTFVEGGVIGPLAVYLIKKDESPFVAFHALQSLLFGLVFAVFTAVIILPFSLCTFGIGAFSLFIFVPIYLGYELVAVLKANEGEWYQLPIVGAIAARHHPPPDQG
jgi:uncharacterized membrane protein